MSMLQTNTLIGKALDSLQAVYIDTGFYAITEATAKRINNGKLPRPGYEACVEVLGVWLWLARTPCGGKILWAVRDAKGWHVVNGTTRLDDAGQAAAKRIYDKLPEPAQT